MPFNLALLDSEKAQEIKESFPEIKEWYLIGHSMGGLAAQKCAYRHSDEYAGLIVLGSRIKVDFSDNDLPILLITASNDGICTSELLEKEKTPMPKNYRHIVIEGGCHSYFASYDKQFLDGTATISRHEQHMQIIDAIMEWLY